MRVVSPTPPGQPPPDRGGDDDGERDEEQADAVAAVLRLELAGGVADPADGAPDAWATPSQNATQPASERA